MKLRYLCLLTFSYSCIIMGNSYAVQICSISNKNDRPANCIEQCTQSMLSTKECVRSAAGQYDSTCAYKDSSRMFYTRQVYPGASNNTCGGYLPPCAIASGTKKELIINGQSPSEAEVKTVGKDGAKNCVNKRYCSDLVWNKTTKTFIPYMDISADCIKKSCYDLTLDEFKAIRGSKTKVVYEADSSLKEYCIPKKGTLDSESLLYYFDNNNVKAKCYEFDIDYHPYLILLDETRLTSGKPSHCYIHTCPPNAESRSLKCSLDYTKIYNSGTNFINSYKGNILGRGMTTMDAILAGLSEDEKKELTDERKAELAADLQKNLDSMDLASGNCESFSESDEAEGCGLLFTDQLDCAADANKNKPECNLCSRATPNPIAGACDVCQGIPNVMAKEILDSIGINTNASGFDLSKYCTMLNAPRQQSCSNKQCDVTSGCDGVLEDSDCNTFPEEDQNRCRSCQEEMNKGNNIEETEKPFADKTFAWFYKPVPSPAAYLAYYERSNEHEEDVKQEREKVEEKKKVCCAEAAEMQNADSNSDEYKRVLENCLSWFIPGGKEEVIGKIVSCRNDYYGALSRLDSSFESQYTYGGGHSAAEVTPYAWIKFNKDPNLPTGVLKEWLDDNDYLNMSIQNFKDNQDCSDSPPFLWKFGCGGCNRDAAYVFGVFTTGSLVAFSPPLNKNRYKYGGSSDSLIRDMSCNGKNTRNKCDKPAENSAYIRRVRYNWSFATPEEVEAELSVCVRFKSTLGWRVCGKREAIYTCAFGNCRNTVGKDICTNIFVSRDNSCQYEEEDGKPQRDSSGINKNKTCSKTLDKAGRFKYNDVPTYNFETRKMEVIRVTSGEHGDDQMRIRGVRYPGRKFCVFLDSTSYQCADGWSQDATKLRRENSNVGRLDDYSLLDDNSMTDHNGDGMITDEDVLGEKLFYTLGCDGPTPDKKCYSLSIVPEARNEDGTKNTSYSPRFFNINNDGGTDNKSKGGSKWIAWDIIPYTGNNQPAPKSRDGKNFRGFYKEDGTFEQELQCAVAHLPSAPFKFFRLATRNNTPALFFPLLTVVGVINPKISLTEEQKITQSTAIADFFEPRVFLRLGNILVGVDVPFDNRYGCVQDEIEYREAGISNVVRYRVKKESVDGPNNTVQARLCVYQVLDDTAAKDTDEKDQVLDCIDNKTGKEVSVGAAKRETLLRCVDRHQLLVGKVIIKPAEPILSYRDPKISAFISKTDTAYLGMNDIDKRTQGVTCDLNNLDSPSSNYSFRGCFSEFISDEPDTKGNFVNLMMDKINMTNEQSGYFITPKKSYCSQLHSECMGSIKAYDIKRKAYDKLSKELTDLIKAQSEDSNSTTNIERSEAIIAKKKEVEDAKIEAEKIKEAADNCTDTISTSCNVLNGSPSLISAGNTDTYIKVKNNLFAYGGYNEYCIVDGLYGIVNFRDDIITKNSADAKCELTDESKNRAECRNNLVVYRYCTDNEKKSLEACIKNFSECQQNGGAIVNGNYFYDYCTKYVYDSGSTAYIKAINCKCDESGKDSSLPKCTDLPSECYKGGYNANYNVLKYDNGLNPVCTCLSGKADSKKNEYNRKETEREVGLCIDIPKAPICEAVYYGKINQTYFGEGETLEKIKETYPESVWRTEEMLNGLSKNNLGHAEFQLSMACLDGEDPDNCIGEKGSDGKFYINGECRGFWKNNEKDGKEIIPQATCQQIPPEKVFGTEEKEYKFILKEGTGCIRYTCPAVTPSTIKNITDNYGQLSAYENKKELELFENMEETLVSNILYVDSNDTLIDKRGFWHGFAYWDSYTKTNDDLEERRATRCLPGYGPAGSKEKLERFMGYREGFGSYEVGRNDIAKEEKAIAEKLMGYRKSGENYYFASASNASLAADMAEHLPVRDCNQIGQWVGVKGLHDPKYWEYSDVFYFITNQRAQYDNLGNDYKINDPYTSFKNFGFVEEYRGIDKDKRGKYCERLYCPAYGEQRILANYAKEFAENSSNEQYTVDNIGYNYSEEEVNKSTYWRHTGGAFWEETPASKLVTDSEEPKGIEVSGICDNDYGFYNIDSLFFGKNYENVEDVTLHPSETPSGNEETVKRTVIKSKFSEQFESVKADVNSADPSVNFSDLSSAIEKKVIAPYKYKVLSEVGNEPIRDCSNYGLWGKIDRPCVRSCEMIDLHRTKVKKSLVDSAKDGAVVDAVQYRDVESLDLRTTNLSFDIDEAEIENLKISTDEKRTIKNNVTETDKNIDRIYKGLTTEDKKKMVIQRDAFDYYRPAFKKVDRVGGEEGEQYTYGDSITGGARWGRTLTKLNEDVTVIGECDSSNWDKEKRFVATNGKQPTRTCRKDGTWGPVQNPCVLFVACKDEGWSVNKIFERERDNYITYGASVKVNKNNGSVVDGTPLTVGTKDSELVYWTAGDQLKFDGGVLQYIQDPCNNATGFEYKRFNNNPFYPGDPYPTKDNQYLSRTCDTTTGRWQMGVNEVSKNAFCRPMTCDINTLGKTGQSTDGKFIPGIDQTAINALVNEDKKFNNKYYVTQTDLSGTFKFKAGDPNVTYVDNKVDLKCSTGYYGGYTATCTLDGDKPKFVYDGYCCKYGYKFVQNGVNITRDVICSGGGTTTNMYTSIAIKLTTTDTTNKVASILTSKVDSNNKAVYRDVRVPMMVELWNSSTPGYKKELITDKTSKLDIDGKEGYGLALKGLNISSSTGLTISLGTSNTNSSITNNITDPNADYTNSYTIKAGKSESGSQNSSYTIQSLAYLCWIGDNNNVNDYCLKRCVGPKAPDNLMTSAASRNADGGELKIVNWGANTYARQGESITGNCIQSNGWFGTVTARCSKTPSNPMKEYDNWTYSGNCQKGCKVNGSFTLTSGQKDGNWISKNSTISTTCPSGFSGGINYRCNGDNNLQKTAGSCYRTFTEATSFTIPSGFTTLTFEVWGQNAGGSGGYVKGTYNLAGKGIEARIDRKEGGTGGSGNGCKKSCKCNNSSSGGGGGAALGLYLNGTIVAVAGGGGGNGGSSGQGICGAGGCGDVKSSVKSGGGGGDANDDGSGSFGAGGAGGDASKSGTCGSAGGGGGGGGAGYGSGTGGSAGSGSGSCGSDSKGGKGGNGGGNYVNTDFSGVTKNSSSSTGGLANPQVTITL